MAEALRVAGWQHGVVTRDQALNAGLTRGQMRQLVRTGGWARPFPGTYLVEGADPFLGRVRAALLRRPEAVVCGVTAARLLNLRGLPRRHQADAEPVHLLVSGSIARSAVPGVLLRFGTCHQAQLWWRDGIPVTSVTRTLADLVLAWDRSQAVALLDAAAHDRRLRDVAEVAAQMFGRHGTAARVRWLADVDARAESPLESRLRLVLGDRGLSPPEVQYVVRDESGFFVARADLAYPAHRLLVEADGVAFHGDEGGDPRPLHRDRERQNALSRLGWKVLRFTWPDVLARPDHVAALVRALLRG
ncbi:type IV toxin-antitoxin system AbiEi family antitoxin domain-containing protein [Frankia nepalensis]|nr:type IV toxin-antitoxin system AbiEi family antitoxin domain-containing protein [Frankia nepalensis]